VDTEEKRFLEFEKWWGGFFKMTAEEIHFIVDSLFIGNDLEQGNLRLGDHKVVNLKNFKDPILVFASGGDNITPPPQALNWIYKVYGTVEEIKRSGQVIIYMVHENVGHLGIFVSGKVARKEHRQILGNIGWLEYLTPGLYEMVIERGSAASGADDYDVRFEAREMEDLLELDDGLEDEEAFLPANALSKFNDFIYRNYAGPWVQAAVIPPMDSWIRMLHPLRMQRYMISDRNLLCFPVKWAAEHTKSQRRPVCRNNTFAALESLCSESVKIGLNYYRDMRDLSQEFVFKSIYDNPYLKLMFANTATAKGTQTFDAKKVVKRINKGKKKSRPKTDKGGYIEACVRIMIAVIGADDKTYVRELETAEKVFQKDPTLRSVSPDTYKKIVKNQASIYEKNPQRALDDLAAMVTAVKDRKRIWAMAKTMVSADGNKPDKKERAVLTAINKALKLTK
jgi:tellurite resistance protein